MKRYFVLFTMLSFPTFAQTIIGTVQKIDKDQLLVKSQDRLVAFQVDEKTTVAKLKKLHDLSLLVPGDEIRVTYYGEQTPTAVNISAKVTLSGAIVEGASNQLMLLPDSKADAKPAETAVFVFLSPGTKLGTSRRQLTVGRRVHVVGWDAGDGVIEADKVAVYDTDLPLTHVPPPRRK
jgi:hypothetical protein